MSVFTVTFLQISKCLAEENRSRHLNVHGIWRAIIAIVTLLRSKLSADNPRMRHPDTFRLESANFWKHCYNRSWNQVCWELAVTSMLYVIDNLQSEVTARTRDTTSTTSALTDDVIQSAALTSLTSPWFLTSPLTADVVSHSALPVNVAQFSQHQSHDHHHHHHPYHQQQHQQQRDERDRLSLAASFTAAAVASASHLPYSTLLQQQHLQLHHHHHHRHRHHEQHLMMTPVTLDSLQWSRDSTVTSCFSTHGKSSRLVL